MDDISMPRRQKPPGKERWTWNEIDAGQRKPKSPTKPKKWRDFERAVYAFAQKLDEKAQVLFDHKVEDVDTGELRQCDVWINARFGGHWPLSILVSCKHLNRVLHVGDIGCFIDEKRSTNADMGVIYSRAGFNDNALKKANKNNISCCRLFSEEVFDIPDAVFFEIYHCIATIGVFPIDLPTELKPLRWNDLLDIPVIPEHGLRTVGDVIAHAFHLAEERSVSNTPGGFPPETATSAQCQAENRNMNFNLLVTCRWQKFVATAKATLVSGSYCLRNNSFVGILAGPAINMKSDHPGPGWEEIPDPHFQEKPIKVLSVDSNASPSLVIEAVRRLLGEQRLVDCNWVTWATPDMSDSSK
jgi:hypothetical protein